jgi:hypothetical protein
VLALDRLFEMNPSGHDGFHDLLMKRATRQMQREQQRKAEAAKGER